MYRRPQKEFPVPKAKPLGINLNPEPRPPSRGFGDRALGNLPRELSTKNENHFYKFPNEEDRKNFLEKNTKVEIDGKIEIVPGVELSESQAIFLGHYLETLDAQQAAKKCRNISPRDAEVLLELPAMRRAISYCMEQYFHLLKVNPSNLIQTLIRVVDLDPAELYYSDGELKSFADMPINLRKLLQSVENTKYGTKVKFIDKLAAIEMLGKHYDIFREKVDVTVSFEDLVINSIREEKDVTPHLEALPDVG